MSDKSSSIDSAVAAFVENRHLFEYFCRSVASYFEVLPELKQLPLPAVHSIKWRVKDASHLREKLNRRWDDDKPVDGTNVFQRITDLAGVRVLHLHQSQFADIHNAIKKQLDSTDWNLEEAPKAYSWDPEAQGYFNSFGVASEIKPSYYTSVHYVIRPRVGSLLCCEIQVRTLFEEIWGEIDHAINYPNPTDSAACKSQIKVMAKLVSTGTRLADAIFDSHREHLSAKRDSEK